MSHISETHTGPGSWVICKDISECRFSSFIWGIWPTWHGNKGLIITLKSLGDPWSKQVHQPLQILNLPFMFLYRLLFHLCFHCFHFLFETFYKVSDLSPFPVTSLCCFPSLSLSPSFPFLTFSFHPSPLAHSDLNPLLSHSCFYYWMLHTSTVLFSKWSLLLDLHFFNFSLKCWFSSCVFMFFISPD